MEDTKKRVGKWDASLLHHDVSMDFFTSEALLQHQCIITWGK